MYAAVISVALVGGDALPVQVEAHVGGAKSVFRLSGLPDTAVREAKDRVRAAVVSSGLAFPGRVVTVNLAPADVPKAGTDYDLPIALGILAASQLIAPLRPAVIVGELSLDGTIRPGGNALGAGVLSARRGLPCLVSRQAAAEAAAIPGARVFGVGSLAEAVALLQDGLETGTPVARSPRPAPYAHPDLAEVRGQAAARRALEVAAAGGHHILMHGPPGAGKTMLARRLPGILPPLGAEEAVEVAVLWASAGRRRGVDPVPPFRSPHHTATRAALVGGGSGVLAPGEVSLAHRGVLFLDELAEFPRANLDTLRQPMEEGVASVSRSGVSMDFPASFQLVAAANPCPCGYLGDPRRSCVCRPAQAARYRARVSGPLLDRFDLVVHVPPMDPDGPVGEDSAGVRSRVGRARERQQTRGVLNRELSPARLRELAIDPEAETLVRKAIASGALTARGADRVRRVARTIADLDKSDVVGESHVAEAIALRVEW